jgi:nicotinate-nucleotide adenylyltransferase
VTRLGLLGGTFNPPHVGHLACARAAHDQLALDRVVLIPAGVPPHKEIAADPGPEERFELCRLAVQAEEERFEVSRVELDRAGRSYTVDTLRALHARGPQDELTFIMGGDMARSLPSWREPEAVLELATLAVAERADAEREAILSDLAVLPGAVERVRFVELPRIDVSSSQIRAKVAAGEPIDGLVPAPVAARIAERGLYA